MASVSKGFANIEQFLINGKPYTKLKVDELKQGLVACGLEKFGLKKELQERLYKALVKETSCTEEAITDISIAEMGNRSDEANGAD